jgi:hypothetical protein
MTPGEYVSVKGEERESWLKVLKAILLYFHSAVILQINQNYFPHCSPIFAPIYSH